MDEITARKALTADTDVSFYAWPGESTLEALLAGWDSKVARRVRDQVPDTLQAQLRKTNPGQADEDIYGYWCAENWNALCGRGFAGTSYLSQNLVFPVINWRIIKNDASFDLELRFPDGDVLWAEARHGRIIDAGPPIGTEISGAILPESARRKLYSYVGWGANVVRLIRQVPIALNTAPKIIRAIDRDPEWLPWFPAELCIEGSLTATLRNLTVPEGIWPLPQTGLQILYVSRVADIDGSP